MVISYIHVYVSMWDPWTYFLYQGNPCLTKRVVVPRKPLVQIGLMQIKEEVPLGHEVYFDFESYCCQQSINRYETLTGLHTSHSLSLFPSLPIPQALKRI